MDPIYILSLGWTLHRSKCACYNYVVMWSCSIFNTTQNTQSKPTVPILCVKSYIILSCQITQLQFQPTLLLLCEATVAMVQSEGLFHWKVCSVGAVMAFTSALSTGLRMEMLLAYIVVMPTGVKIPFTYFIAKTARSLYSKGQQYQVSL